VKPAKIEKAKQPSQNFIEEFVSIDFCIPVNLVFARVFHNREITIGNHLQDRAMRSHLPYNKVRFLETLQTVSNSISGDLRRREHVGRSSL